MLEQLMNLVRQNGQEAITDNPDIPAEHNEGVMQEASQSIFSGLQQTYQQQGAGGLKSLFEGAQSGDPDHPAVQQISNNFAGNIGSKFGIPSGAAKALAVSLIPMVMRQLFNRTKDPNDSGFNIGSILSSITGGGAAASIPQMGGGMASGGGLTGSEGSGTSGGGFLDSMGEKFGLDKNKDGHTDLKDLMSMFGH